ncbi:MAG: DNA/RNA non-specific endonuclease [Flammeovirgaceae bacterium]
MFTFTQSRIYLVAFLALFAFACTDQDIIPEDESLEDVEFYEMRLDGELPAATFDGEEDDEMGNAILRTSSFTETFDNYYKGSYAGANAYFNSGTWYLSDALTGSSSRDRKYGSRSVRIRNTGYAIMQFNMDQGIGAVTVKHAKYGSDGTSRWRLMASTNNGSSWFYLGAEFTTNSTSFKTATINVNIPSAVRIGIQKTAGGGNRINIDNVAVTKYSGSGGGGSAPATRDSNLTFGNPSNASTSSTNYLVSRNEYALAYNESKGTPKWVSWHLSDAWLGSASRNDNFRVDTSLPSNFYRPSHSDYTGSGFDRGHICPSADRTYSTSANSNTFYMSNIGPQAPRNNQQTWRYFEEYCRDLAEAGYELHIVAGVAGRGGTGRNGYRTTIDGGNIEVPSSFWKSVLVLPNGSSDVSRVDLNTRIITVNIPNNESISTNWASYRTSVNTIESLTGLDLFKNISNSYENTLESRVDNGPTQ